MTTRKPVLFPAPSIWAERAKKYGRRCVVDLSTPESQFDAWTERQWSYILPVLQRHRPSRIRRMLDYGCGCGRFTGKLADYAPLTRVVGYDPCEELIAMAPAHEGVVYMSEDPLYRYAVYEMLFQVILVTLVFGGLNSVKCQEAAASITRLLDPNGILLFAEHISESGGGSDFWKFRAIEWYREIFPKLDLAYDSFYITPQGTSVSIYVGRKK